MPRRQDRRTHSPCTFAWKARRFESLTTRELLWTTSQFPLTISPAAESGFEAIPSSWFGAATNNLTSTACREVEPYHHISGSAQANRTPPLLVNTYCRPSSSYVVGELTMGAPEPACHNVLPSVESSARKLPEVSPVNVRPESVVNTPAPGLPGPTSCVQRIFPV